MPVPGSGGSGAPTTSVIVFASPIMVEVADQSVADVLTES
jgi:hypothetical protein